MAIEKNGVFFPGRVYKLPMNQVNGYFLFVSEAEATSHAVFYKSTSRNSNIGSVDRGYFGCSQVVAPNTYIRCENGTAVYYGDKHFSLYETLNTADLRCGDFCQVGTTVFENAICNISVMQRKKDPALFRGDSVVMVFDQFVFCVNSRMYWGGFIENLSFKSYNNIIVSMHDQVTKNDYVFGINGVRMSSTLSDSGQPFTLSRIGKNDFFTIELPKNIDPNQMSISWLQPSSGSVKCYPVYQSIEEIYRDEFGRLSEVITSYIKLGLELNVQKELAHLNGAPDFAECCYTFLSEQLTKYSNFLQKPLDKSRKFTFHVGTSYDKKYYCAAKLAESALEIQKDQDRPVYYITFEGTQVEEIELMYFNLVSPFNSEKDYMVDIKTYLSENSYFSHLQSTIDSYVGNLREHFGYSRVVTNSVLIRIIKSINKNRRRRLELLYTEMIAENRVNVRWSSEYKLFSLVSEFVPDAIYQYRTVWLGAQSFDVFLPSQKIAIEYQGQQHYEAVELFGGQEAFERNVDRDIKKRELGSAYGVVVLDWKYSIPVTSENVISFLSENGIKLSVGRKSSASNVRVLMSIDMAPVLSVADDGNKKSSTPQIIIKQYLTDGSFVANHQSYESASLAVGVSKQQVSNAVRGVADTAGGYMWRKTVSGDISDNDAPIKPLPMAVKSNNAKRILQLSSDGKVLVEYESINKASKATGISSKRISLVVNGKNKTAGGYLWVAKENT